MPSVKVRQDEPFDVILRRFRRACEKAGLFTEMRRREHSYPLEAIPNSLRNNGSVSTMRCSLTLRVQLQTLTCRFWANPDM